MTASEPGFAHLRSLLSAQANTIVWYDICSWLEDHATEEEGPLAMAYAGTHLEEWPNKLRSRYHLDIHSPTWPLVRSLHLSDDEALYNLRHDLREEDCQHLSHLHVYVCRHPETLEWLVQQSWFANLKSLNFGFEEPFDSMNLLAGVVWERLEEVELRHCQLSSASWEQLVNRLSQLPLTSLCLDFCALQDIDLKALLASPALVGLKRLRLTHNQLTESFVEWLSKEEGLRELNELVMYASGLGERAAESIAKARWLRSVKMLDLSRNAIGDEGVKALLQSPNRSPRLRMKVLDHNNLSQEMIQKVSRHRSIIL